MGIVTTRRAAELRAEAHALGIPVPEGAGREQIFDLLREYTGSFDPSMEIDPMKAKDLKHEIAWGTPNPFAALSKYFTDDWAMDPKLDGCRMRWFAGLRGNTMNTGRRSVKTYSYTSRSDNFPHLRDAVIPELVGTILDGEIMAPHAKITTHTGMQTNSILNASVALCNSGPAGAVSTQAREGNAVYWIFDILAHKGDNVQALSLTERRALLEEVHAQLVAAYPDCNIKLVPQFESSEETIKQCLEAGFEGVMIKLREGRYMPGKRSGLWLKVKTFSTADAFIVGYAAGKSGNEGFVGSLDLAVFTIDVSAPNVDPANNLMIDGVDYYVRPVAQVGNLTEDLRKQMSAADGSLRHEWLGRVVEWMAQGLGKNGRARHAHLVRLRPDKHSSECMDDQLDCFPAV